MCHRGYLLPALRGRRHADWRCASPAAAAVHPQPAVDVAAIEGGGFIITFPDGDGSDENVLAARFDAAGEQIGGLIPVATEVGVDAQSPAIATLGDGSFVAVWDDETANQIRFRLIGADGVPVGAAVAIADNPSNPSGPDVLVLANGGFVVTWADANQASPDTDGTAVRAQVFDAAGDEVGDEFTVNTFAAGFQNSRPPTRRAARRHHLAGRLRPVTGGAVGGTWPACARASAATTGGRSWCSHWAPSRLSSHERRGHASNESSLERHDGWFTRFG